MTQLSTDLEQAEVNARNPARGCYAEEVSLRCYPTYLDDGIEDEGSPEDDDSSRLKSEEMKKQVTQSAVNAHGRDGAPRIMRSVA